MERRKIIIVGDDKNDILNLEKMFELENFEILTALDGLSCLSIVKEKRPSLILLDEKIQNTSTYKMDELLSNNDATKNIPVILLTSLSNAVELLEGFENGISDFIKKPYNKIEVLARVKSALRFSETKELLLNLEKNKMFSSVIQKTNHDVKQPLTLISLAASAIKREIENKNLDKNAVKKRVKYIEDSVKDISKILETMQNIKNSDVKDYIKI